MLLVVDGNPLRFADGEGGEFGSPLKGNMGFSNSSRILLTSSNVRYGVQTPKFPKITNYGWQHDKKIKTSKHISTIGLQKIKETAETYLHHIILALYDFSIVSEIFH